MVTGKIDYELDLTSSVALGSGSIAQITARPDCIAFRGKRLVIQNGERWLVRDIKVGVRSQLKTSEPIPGIVFSPVAESDTSFDICIPGIVFSLVAESDTSFDICQSAADVSVIVEYVGSNPEGEIFEAKMYGVAIV